MVDLPPPTDALEWDKLGLTPMDVNGHVESDYSVNTSRWSEPRFIQDPFLRIHGLAPGLNYAYRDPKGLIQVFRPKEHAARLSLSCSTIAIPPIPEDIFLRGVNLAVVKNAEYVPPHDTDAALYIRPLVFGSDAFFAVSAGTGYKFCIYVQPYKAYHGVHPLPALILEDFDRAAPKGVGHVKVGGNYAPVLKWSDQARAEGFFMTLHLDSRDNSEVDEFSTSAFIGLKQSGSSYTLVSPNSRSILKSVTSTSCIELAKSFGWNVEIRPVSEGTADIPCQPREITGIQIPYSELPYFTEVLAAGTAAMILPVKSITRRSTGDTFEFAVNGPGEGCKKLSKALLDVQKGIVKSDLGWLWQVSPVSNAESA
ncbi:branched-chain amino acid aminotransferase [Trichophyton rubrum]|uniref:Branched-chain amino acid aminotransferase n=1 Tax=Trichophyton rubrum TaxID=5551 RepID=A0A178F9D0_TRIRU|nr:branched-chain amino acid aminotransferase [Trichophyton rubrum]